MFLPLLLLFVAVLAMAPASALADCVDINADPPDRLTAITHIDDERAVQLISGRPWPSVGSLTGINGIGRSRIIDRNRTSAASTTTSHAVSPLSCAEAVTVRQSIMKCAGRPDSRAERPLVIQSRTSR